MAFHTAVPVRAELIEVVTGVLPEPSQFAGQAVTLKHYRIPAGYADAGTEHVRLEVAGERPRRYQYSGANVHHAARQVEQLKEALAAGQVVAHAAR